MKVYFCEGKRRKRNREDPHPNLGLQIGDSAPGRVGTSSFSGVDRLDISLFQNSTQPSRFKPDLLIGLFHVGPVMRRVSVVRMVCWYYHQGVQNTHTLLHYSMIPDSSLCPSCGVANDLRCVVFCQLAVPSYSSSTETRRSGSWTLCSRVHLNLDAGIRSTSKNQLIKTLILWMQL